MAGDLRDDSPCVAALRWHRPDCARRRPAILRKAAALLVWLLATLLLAPAAHAREPRLALVIGNSAYQACDRLAATTTDGDRIAAALNGAGFLDATGSGPVTAHRDLTREQMLALIDQFAAKLKAAEPNAFGMLYLSGHGAMPGTFGDVMLLPVDADHTLSAEATGLTRAAIARKLLGSGARNPLIVLDMCRYVLKEPPLPNTLPPPDMVAAPPVSDSGPDGTKGLRRIVPAELAQTGSPANEPKRGGNEQLQREQRIEHPFAISIYEVTVAEWNSCVRDKACQPGTRTIPTR